MTLYFKNSLHCELGQSHVRDSLMKLLGEWTPKELLVYTLLHFFAPKKGTWAKRYISRDQADFICKKIKAWGRCHFRPHFVMTCRKVKIVLNHCTGQPHLEITEKWHDDYQYSFAQDRVFLHPRLNKKSFRCLHTVLLSIMHISIEQIVCRTSGARNMWDINTSELLEKSV